MNKTVKMSVWYDPNHEMDFSYNANDCNKNLKHVGKVDVIFFHYRVETKLLIWWGLHPVRYWLVYFGKCGVQLVADVIEISV